MLSISSIVICSVSLILHSDGSAGFLSSIGGGRGEFF